MKAYGAKVLAVAIAFILFIQPAVALTEMSAPLLRQILSFSYSHLNLPI